MHLRDRLDAFRGKSVFVTGHTGFKGSWLALWLSELGARVTGYALKPPTEPNNFTLSAIRQRLVAHHEQDVRDLATLRAAIGRAAPDVIFHLAAQPLVLESYRNPLETFEINVMGSANLLESVRQTARPCAIVIVTSDKCYENREWTWGYRESDALGGHDPYSASKGATEILVGSYRRSFFSGERLDEHGVRLASARAGNVIGGGDWSPNHIVVDVIDSLVSGKAVGLRNPRAIRPWQHVLESLSGYLTLASALMTKNAATFCDAWNFGPRTEDAISVSDLVDCFIASWGSGAWNDISDRRQPHEAHTLRLSIDKAQTLLDWHPQWNVAQAVTATVQWYRMWQVSPARLPELAATQIREYSAAR